VNVSGRHRARFFCLCCFLSHARGGVQPSHQAFYKMLLLPEIKPGALDLEDLTSASPMLAKGLQDVSAPRQQ
jgi:hypothetical protein